MSKGRRTGIVCIMAAFAIIGMLAFGHLNRSAWIELWLAGTLLVLAGNLCLWMY